MPRFVARQTIASSADTVWAYATDIGRHGEWMTITDARVVRGDGTQVGARGRERMRFGPFGWDVEFEVAEADPGRRVAWRSVSGAPFDLEVALELEPAGHTSTTATYGADIQLHGLWRLIGPIIAMEGRTGPERELGRLKARVEAGPAAAGAAA